MTMSHPIDRRALVERHSPRLRQFDPRCPFTVGNGEFAFTADITGLQTFPDCYDAHGMPLGTMAQWGWHSEPPPAGYTAEDFAWTPLESHGRQVPYPYTGGAMFFGLESAYWPLDPVKETVGSWLGRNPHRLHLGVIGLALKGNYGQGVGIEDLSGIAQSLDLWSGTLHSRFLLDGATPVTLQTCCHPVIDQLAARIASPLLADGRRLNIRLAFPAPMRGPRMAKTGSIRNGMLPRCWWLARPSSPSVAALTTTPISFTCNGTPAPPGCRPPGMNSSPRPRARHSGMSPAPLPRRRFPPLSRIARSPSPPAAPPGPPSGNPVARSILAAARMRARRSWSGASCSRNISRRSNAPAPRRRRKPA